MNDTPPTYIPTSTTLGALREAAAAFRAYEAHHTQKGNGLKGEALREAHEKADRNQRLAVLLEAAIKRLEGPQVDQRLFPSFELVPANDGGFVLMGARSGLLGMTDPGRARSFDFAGSLDACLDYIRSRITAEA